MSNPKGTRRAVAEISWAGDPGAVIWVGNRPVHSCWPLISAYFRDLLLPPHRRAEDEAVSWNWHEQVNPPALTSAEIQSVRRRLESEIQLLLENVSSGRPGEARGNPNQVDMDELGAALRDWVRQVVARPDPELAAYLCRTDQGLRLHSWGAAKASAVRFSDANALNLAGHVLVGGMPALHDVLLETGDGEMLAETPSDSLGSFRFSKLAPGKYRLRARSKRGTFPLHGVVVVLSQTSVVDVVLADDSPVATPTRGRRAVRNGNRRKLTLAAALALVVGGAGWVAVNRSGSPDTTVAMAKSETVAPVNVGPGAATDSSAVGNAGKQSSPSGSNQQKSLVASTSKSATTSGALASSAVREEPATSLVGKRKDDSLPVTAASGPATGAAATTPPTAGVSANQNRSGTAALMPTTPAVVAGASPVSGATTAPSSAPMPTPAVGRSPDPTAAAASAVSAAGSVSAAANSQPGTSAAGAVETAVSSVTASAAELRAGPVATRPELPSPPDRAAASQVSPSLVEATSGASNVEASKPASSEAGNVAATPSPTAQQEPSAPSQSSRSASDADAKALSVNASVPAMRMSSARLTRTVRVRLSSWRVRLMEDSILPTQPLRAGQVEPVAALRQQILAEQKAKLPATLTQSEVLSGLRVQIAPSDFTDGLAWRDEQGAVIADSRVESGRAEITWAAANAPVDRPVRLSGRNGVVLAEARYEPQTRELVVRTAEETQAWLRWVIRAVPGDASRVPAGDTGNNKTRFAWRTGTGDPVPTGWHISDAADANADHRVDLPLGSVFGSVAAQSCALLDHVTGWALVTEIRQAADRPLGL